MSLSLAEIASRVSRSARRCDEQGYMILAPGDPGFDQSGYVVISRTLLWKLQEAIGTDSTRAAVKRPDPHAEENAELRAAFRASKPDCTTEARATMSDPNDYFRQEEGT